MFDLSQLQYSSEYPGLVSVVFTTICSIVLGTLLAFTYDKTTSTIERPNHFLQAMILVTVVSSMIIQAIGDSVARGLGMIGALSIIRFRTTVRDPRNIVFMFSAIAIGIACGVFGFLIAFVGTIGFCITAFLLKWSSFNKKDHTQVLMSIVVLRSIANMNDVMRIIRAHSKDHMLSKKSIGTGKRIDQVRMEYKLKLKDEDSGHSLLNELNGLEGVTTSRMNYEYNQYDNI